MFIAKVFDESCVRYTVFITDEYEPVRGNAIHSGHEDVDRSVEDGILADLAQGNSWAWCTVHVSADIAGIDFYGEDRLGACSYKNEEEFRACAYFEDMKSNALEDLVSNATDFGWRTNKMRFISEEIIGMTSDQRDEIRVLLDKLANEGG
jgi:hypothetical protein